jgi:hypothetical protein
MLLLDMPLPDVPLPDMPLLDMPLIGAPELLLGAMLPGEAPGAGEASGEASPPVGAGEGAGAFWAQAMPAVSNRAVEASQRVRMGYSPGRSGCSAMRIIWRWPDRQPSFMNWPKN